MTMNKKAVTNTSSFWKTLLDGVLSVSGVKCRSYEIDFSNLGNAYARFYVSSFLHLLGQKRSSHNSVEFLF